VRRGRRRNGETKEERSLSSPALLPLLPLPHSHSSERLAAAFSDISCESPARTHAPRHPATPLSQPFTTTMAATLRSAGGVTVRTTPATPCRLPAAAAAGASCRRQRPAHAGPAADMARRRGRGRHPHVPRASTSPSGAASAAWARARSPSRGPGSDPPLWDCVGMGEALVDCCAAVEDGLLVEFGVAKGGRR
jgi:hypothetical protein